ncbi:MAG: glycosyltransferase 36 associated protein [Acidobacteriota bacterium]|nr:glycosyltransferase 36 associated protein [Acidobacteriota bacterium]
MAFAASSPRAASWTGDRTQFLGRNRSLAKPEGLERARLDNRTGTGADPNAALQVSITLDRDSEAEVIFLLGETDSVDTMKSIVSRYSNSQEVARALQATKDWWNQTLGAVQVHTPVLSTNFLLNGWLLYQSLSCRFWGRSGLYQSSGALGFRDQLQDCLALLYSNPQLTRKHILTAAARQFLEGDVQHWWHAETGMGVRTRCSDDLLWLPFVVSHYAEVTGDTGILDEVVPFIEGPVLGAHEQERMFTPPVSQQTAPLWDHCRRAIEHSLQFGQHGLPLIGNGDWNDGMNLVGAEGKGESVWLAWFQAYVLEAFAKLWEPRDGETNLVAGWRQRAEANKRTVDSVAWDGEWYLRGYFDDGSSLGSHNNQEARIDSLPQSWSVISGSPDLPRSRQAMMSAEKHLVREKEKLVLLLSPPFDHSTPNPGYIMGYPPGLRENGGQYTHGAIWLAMAWARLGEGDRAVRLLQMMNPVELTRNPADTAHYRGEPYVVAADVSLGANRAGQAGWTWYTGSAGWMYRVWLEEVLGFRVNGTTFTVEPAIPAEWPGFDLTWKHRTSTYNVKVVRYPGLSQGEPQTLVDGEPVTGGVPLIDDGRTCNVEIRIPLQNVSREPASPGAALTTPLTRDYAVAE